MPITLYGTELSPPVRAVCLVSKALGLEYDFKHVDLMGGEHMTPEFLKMNPVHTVPAVVDGDFSIFESHAIVAYLVGKYGKDDSMCPKDLRKRAVVDQRLHFDTGILFHRLRDMLEPVLFRGDTTLDPLREQKCKDALIQLDALLGDNAFVAGPTPTIADCCCVATASSIIAALPDTPVPPKVTAWIKRCEEKLPAYKEVNAPGAQKLGALFRSKLK